MLEDRVPIKRLPIYSIRPEAKVIYDALPKNIQEMYRTEQCSMCGAHLTVRQLNRIIIGGVPPVCVKCYKTLQGRMEQLAPLFGQLGLF